MDAILATHPLSALKTPAAADALQIPYWMLHQLIRERRLAPPSKDSSGDYLWTPNDIERARRAVEGRRVRRKAGSA